MRKVFAVLLAVCSLFSAFFVMAAIGDLLDGDGKTSTGVLLGLLVFFGGTTLGSALGARALWRAKPVDYVALEPKLLELARHHAWRLTIADVAVGLGLPLKQARAGLDHLVDQGAADLFVDDEGTMVFEVRGASSRALRDTAERV